MPVLVHDGGSGECPVTCPRTARTMPLAAPFRVLNENHPPKPGPVTLVHSLDDSEGDSTGPLLQETVT